MSYQVLARKWRPHNFQEVVGQQHVLTALENGLAQNRVHHAYLFSGTRGVGKTTIARIFAKSLNCEQGVTATPCGKCVNCQAIDQGRFVDLLEIDAASRTKVDDTREMLDNVQYKPAQGRYKVYLIDEVHMLSKHSFNALLKTLEEPPEYVKFLLATTDPQKLPITVLSRCLQFHLKAISPVQIENQLAFILQQEQASFEHAALVVIAKAADGSMRDALSLTDQALAFGSGDIKYQAVLKMVGTIDNNHLYYLLHFIASGNVKKVFEKIEEFVHLGADFAKLHQELATLCHQIACEQMLPKNSTAEQNTIQLLAQRLTPEEVQLYYQIALQGYKDYAFAPNGKVALEMTVMRLLAFKPANYITLDEAQLQSTVNIEVIENRKPVSEIDNMVAVLPDVQTAIMATTVVVEADVQSAMPLVATTVERAVVETVSTAEVQAVTTAHVVEIVETAETRELLSRPQEVKTQAVVSVDSPLEIERAPVSDSRNMLRSHRLKREKQKKLIVISDNKRIQTAIAEPVQEASRKATAETVQQSVKQKPVQEAVKAVTPSPAAEVIEPPADMMPEQELPPLDSYFQESLVENGYSDNIIENEPPAPVPLEQKEAQKEDKSAVFSDQPFEAVEIDIAGYVADKLTCPWSLSIQKMQLIGLVKLLAKNSVMKQLNEQIVLTLKPAQQHLLNNSSLCEQLQVKLKEHYGQQTVMYIEVGEVDGELTPVESELVIFQHCLDNAKKTIINDENIQFLQSEYGAKIYENSIIPL